MANNQDEEEKRIINIEEYKQQLDKNKRFWKSIEISSIIGKTGDEWILLGLEVIFNEQQYSKETFDILLETPIIRMIKEIKNIEYIEELFNNLKNKYIRIADYKVKVEGFHFDWGRSGKSRNPLEIQIEWPVIWLRAYGKSVRELIDERHLDEKLIQLGYGHLYEESMELFNFHIGQSRSTLIHIIAPIYLKIDVVTFEGEKMTVKVLAHNSILLKDFQILSPILRGEPLPLKKITENGVFNTFFGEKSDIPLDKESIILRVFLKGQSEQIDFKRIYRAPHEIAQYNPRMATLFSLIKEGLFRKWLGIEERITPPRKGEEKNLNPYEKACVNLFSCAGFIVFNFGKGFDIIGADLIAFAPVSKDIILISCVATSGISEKIEKIKPVSNKLKDELKEYNIYTVICSPAPSDDIVKKYKDSCKEEKIALITADEMKEIYDMAIKGNYDEILNYIRDTIENDYYSPV